MLDEEIRLFFTSYFGYSPDGLEKKQVIEIFEDAYNSGEHPKVEFFVEMNYSLFEK